jgi:glycosyltransferase involved in cell wall biosynthesis
VASLSLSVHRALGTYSRHIQLYIALTDFQRQQMVAGGLPSSKIRVVTNSLEPDPGPGRGNRSGVLFIGRLSEEKGVAPLLRAAQVEPGVLRVGGRGPLQTEVLRASAEGRIDYLGALDRTSVFDQLRNAVAVVVPSICFETFGLVVMEAFASATPVIASRIGALAELVEDGVTGILSPPGDADALATHIRWAVDHPDDMKRLGANARMRYETQFRGAAHLTALLDAYKAARRPAGQAVG